MISTCLIPPFAELDSIRYRRYHLILTHLLKNPEYLKFYSSIHNVQTPTGKTPFVILDNSAHELEMGEPIEKVFTIGREIDADEIVIPDCLFDRARTLESTEVSLSWLVQHQDDFEYAPQLMFVAQGNSRAQTIRCVWDQIRAWEHYAPKLRSGFKPTMGISKDYEIWPGGLFQLVHEAIVPAADAIKANIHLLGWGRKLWDLRQIAEQYGNRIRSVDSAKPYVYGIGNITLNPRYVDLPEYPRRPDNYFNLKLTNRQRVASEENIRVFEATARGGII